MRRAALLVSCALVLSACGGEEPAPETLQSVSPTGSALPTTAAPSESPSHDEELESAEDPMTMLIIGADRDTGTQRADVIMLVRIDDEREHASAMSIHRDTWVDIPGYGQNKINASFAYGGEELLAETVDLLYSADIDHTVVVDFDAFTELSQILGPITVETAGGPVVLEGDEALSFVRERYSLPGGDFDRVRRQQAYLAAAADAVRNASPAERADLAEMVGDYVTVDGAGGFAVYSLILSLIAETEGIEGVFFSAPHDGTGLSDDGQSIVLVDEDAGADLASAYEDDTVDEWLSENEAETLDSRPLR